MNEYASVHLSATAVPYWTSPLILLGPACGAEDWTATTTSVGQVTCQVCQQIAGIQIGEDEEG
jgi:hypothetical protein